MKIFYLFIYTHKCQFLKMVLVTTKKKNKKERKKQFLSRKFQKNAKLPEAIFLSFFDRFSKINPLSCTTGLALSYKAIKTFEKSI